MRTKGIQIIRSFSSNIIASTREFFMQEFENGNTRIMICTDTAGIGINIQDMAHAIQ